MNESDVLIIGAGPSGSVAGALLAQAGRSVTVLERQKFPRFSIGESLLPQSMEFLERAQMLRAVVEAGYQYKNGAAFVRGERHSSFDFRDKFSPGWGTTYQVVRADFDNLLAQEAARLGARVLFEHEILEFEHNGAATLVVKAPDGAVTTYRAQFVLDGSGFGRVLPRLLNLERPSGFPLRRSIFTHVADRIDSPDHDRAKILIAVHPDHQDVWYWLIPFPRGRCSVGVVARDEFLESRGGELAPRLQQLICEEPTLARLLAHAEFDTPVREIRGYAADVAQMAGPGFALLGNAGEFLDPVFSSGVTIAMKSAVLATDLLGRMLDGGDVDWESEFARPLKRGVDTFRAFVEAWYDGRFQDIVFAPEPNPRIKQMICAVLAGYAWDESNPYVESAARRISALAKSCRE